MRILAFLAALALLLVGCTAMPQNPTVVTNPPTDPTQPSQVDCTHTDGDDNGLCDDCSISVLTTFDVYTINDLHGKISDGDNHPGVDELTTYLEGTQYLDDNVILLSVGDMWQGTAESNQTHGMLVTDWMNYIGFDAMTLGNHEFDWGEDDIEANAQLAQFPFLAINIYDRETDQRVSYCDSSVVIEADGIQIGVIGAMGDCYSSIAADKVEDVYFKTGAELTRLVKEESQRLRAEGVDFIIYTLHDGFGQSRSDDGGKITSGQLSSYYDTELSKGYVDLVFEGHTHQKYLLEDGNDVLHLQNRGDNKGGICHVEVQINTVTGSYHVTVAELVSTSSYDSFSDHAIVEELLEKYKEQIAPAYQLVGTNRKKRSSNELKQTVADLYYAAGLERWSGEYPIVLGGGFISVRSPYDLPAGEVYYGDLQSLLPFDNDLVLCSVKGSDLLRNFINSSNSNYYICTDRTLASGIRADETYYIVVDTYTASWGPNRLTVVEEYTPGIYARDLLAEYIKNGGYQ